MIGIFTNILEHSNPFFPSRSRLNIPISYYMLVEILYMEDKDKYHNTLYLENYLLNENTNKFLGH